MKPAIMNAIEIDQLTKSFRGKKRAVVNALRDVTFTIQYGEVFGFLGPNGAGKSTTIKILTGQIRPDAGSARISGIAVDAPMARRRVGYLPENPAFFEFLSAREYLRFVGRAFAMNEQAIAESSMRVLDQLDLTAEADRPVRGFSKGMIQRLGLAQALLHDPDVFILDEPMSGLDPMGRSLVKEIIKRLKQQGKTVFFSTHITADVEEVCDRVAILARGELRTVRVVAELLAAGVEGYLVRLEQSPPALLRELAVGEELSPDGALYVPCSMLHEFMRNVDNSGSKILSIEPRRGNLEDFFLKTIA